jgi:hypothetical protein
MNFKKVIASTFVAATVLGTAAPVVASADTLPAWATSATDAAVQTYLKSEATSTAVNSAVELVAVANFLQTSDSANQAQTAINALEPSSLKDALNKNLFAIKMNMANTIQAMQLKHLASLVYSAYSSDNHPAAIQAALTYANQALSKPVSLQASWLKNGLLTTLAHAAFFVAGAEQVQSYTNAGTTANTVYGTNTPFNTPSVAGTAANFQLAYNVVNAISGDSVFPAAATALTGTDAFTLNPIVNNFTDSSNAPYVGTTTGSFGQYGQLTTVASNAYFASTTWKNLVTDSAHNGLNTLVFNDKTNLLNELIQASSQFNVQYLNGNFTN